MYGLKYIYKQVPVLDKDGKQVIGVDKERLFKLKLNQVPRNGGLLAPER
jgi:hypothetical protein